MQSCADAGAECGVVDDNCGNVLDCGGCEKGEFCGVGGPNICGTGDCEARACETEECGQVDDGCGGIISCGGCGEAATCGKENICECAVDKFEPNSTAVELADLGAYEDDTGFSGWFKDLTLKNDEEDWFVADISDEWNFGNPNFRVTVVSDDDTAKIDVSVHFLCNFGRGEHVCFGGKSSPDDSSCDNVLVADGESWLGMEVSCAGSKDSGRAVVRIRRKCEGADCYGLCLGYSLGLLVH